jgi:hypothetical protein
MDDLVDLVRRHARPDGVSDMQQRLGGQPADGSHEVDLFGALDFYSHGDVPLFVLARPSHRSERPGLC